MKNTKKTLIISASLMVLSLNVSAHDASKHAKKAEKADCTSYNKMIESGKKMDMKDPVMMAMMKKCKNQAANHDQHEEKKADMKAKMKSEMKCGNMKDSSEKTGEKKHDDMKKSDHKKKKAKKHDDKKSSDK